MQLRKRTEQLHQSEEKTTEERIAEAKLLQILHQWWGSIVDYETNMEEMGSASEAGIVPETPEMAMQLEGYETIRSEVWPHLSKEARLAIMEVEKAFLGFMARAYRGIYGHEVYGHLVPKAVTQNLTIREFISTSAPGHSFPNCEQAYREARTQLGN